MIEQKYGRIVNIASFSGQAGNFGQANYAASKGGIIAFTKVLALELAKYNITANVVAPGFTATDMLAAVPGESDQIRNRNPARAIRGATGNREGRRFSYLRRRLYYRAADQHQRGHLYVTLAVAILAGAGAQPLVDMRPGGPVRRASGHDPDVTAGNAEEFLVLASDLREDCFGLAWGRDVIALRDHGQQIRPEFLLKSTRSPRIDQFALHQAIVAVEVDDELAVSPAGHGNVVGDPGIHRVPGLDDLRIVEVVPKLQ